MRHWMAGLTLFLLAGVFQTQANQGIFYQPQLRDATISETRWDEILTQVKREGFDTLIVQWTRYGETFTKPAEKEWLAARLKRAQSAGWTLILGLYSDPAFFQRQDQNASYLTRYLSQQESHNLTLAQEWQERLGQGRIAGWYLPAELDDLNWRDPERQALLAQHLRSSVKALRKVDPVPVYISSFFTGKMSPQAYRDLLTQMAAEGVSLMVQDGSGTGVLTQRERELYLSALEPCEGRVTGLVRELFVQKNESGTFRAGPLAEPRQRALWSAPNRCGSQHWFFSLRYLPGLSDMR